MITFKRILSTAKLVSKFEFTALNHIKLSTQLTHLNMYNFAFMSLFENNKSPGELNHVFKRVTKLKGHQKFKKNNNIVSKKLNPNRSVQKTSLKNHRGLLKRIKIVGPRWDRQFKFQSPDRYHLRRHKSSNNLRRKTRARYIHKSDIYRVKRLIPYFKTRMLKAKY